MNYTLVGAVVLALGAALVAGVLWLAAGGAWRQKVDFYWTMMEEPVSGLSINAPVKFNGVDVGQVRVIKLDPANPERVILTLAIQRGTPITVDTVAVLRTQGLTGISSVDLAGGSRDSAPLLPGPDGAWPVIQSKPSLSARLEDVLTTVLAKVERTSSNLDALLSDANRAAVSSSLKDMAVLTRALATRSPALERAIDSAAQTLQQTHRAAAVMATELSPLIERVGRSADALEVMGNDTARAGTQAALAVVQTGQDVRQLAAQTTPDVQRLLAELQALSLSMRRLGDAAERSPSSLLLGRGVVADGPGEAAAANRAGQR